MSILTDVNQGFHGMRKERNALRDENKHLRAELEQERERGERLREALTKMMDAFAFPSCITSIKQVDAIEQAREALED